MWSPFLLILLCVAAQAQVEGQSISGPVLGFTREATGGAIWPIIGVPGAAMLAGRLQLEEEVRDVVISPTQDFALAVRIDNGSVVAINTKADPPVVTLVRGTHSNPSAIGISPTGSAAAIYDSETRSVQVVGHLPQGAEVLREFDLSGIEARPTGMALSDDAAIVLVSFADELWAVDASGSWRVGSESSATAAFLPNRHDAIVADDLTQTVFLMMNIDQSATRVPVLSAADGLESFSSVSVSRDGREVFIAGKSGRIAIVDMDTRRSVLTECQCRPTGLHPLNQGPIFRLTDASGEPMTVLDYSSGKPQMFIIPPAAQ